MSEISMREMLEAGVHFGHQTRYWNPKMAAYLYGHRNKIHIIDLEKTKVLLQEALNFAGKLSANKGTILFVGTKRAAQQIIKEEAQRCGMPYINLRWLGGLLTNYKTVRQSINRLKELEEMKAGGMERMSKKEILHFERELEKLDRNLSGIKDMDGWPDALFVIDVGYEDIAVSEAVKLKIPVIGIVDSNNSPAGVEYVIPGNDDAIRSIRLYTKAVADAIITGKDSVAHLGEGGDKDDFVELDAEGAPIVEAKEEKVVVRKKAVREKIRKSTETEADAGDAQEQQASAEVPAEEQAAEAVAEAESPAGSDDPEVETAVDNAGANEDGAAAEAQAEDPAAEAVTGDVKPAETEQPKRAATKSAGTRSAAKKAPAKTAAKAPAKTAAKAPAKTAAKAPAKTAAKAPAKTAAKAPAKTGKAPAKTRQSPGKNHGKSPGKDTGKKDAGKSPGKDTGKNRGKNTGKSPGKDTGKNRGKDTGKNRGKNHGKSSRKSPGKGISKSPGKNKKCCQTGQRVH